jgi:hypothetical protein
MDAFIEADASGLIPSNTPFANIQYRLSCEDSTVPLMTSIASKQDGGLMHEMLEASAGSSLPRGMSYCTGRSIETA